MSHISEEEDTFWSTDVPLSEVGRSLQAASMRSRSLSVTICNHCSLPELAHHGLAYLRTIGSNLSVVWASVEFSSYEDFTSIIMPWGGQSAIHCEEFNCVRWVRPETMANFPNRFTLPARPRNLTEVRVFDNDRMVRQNIRIPRFADLYIRCTALSAWCTRHMLATARCTKDNPEHVI